MSVAGKTLTGWTVLDMDGTLITAHSDKEGAAPTWKKGYGFHPLGTWCANTEECLAILLRPGNAGANDAADHIAVLDQAIAQVPAAFRTKLLILIDGAGATHDLVNHMNGLATTRRTVRFTIGWTITTADEHAIAKLPQTAWQAALTPDGGLHEHAAVAELSDLDPRAKTWGVRLIVRRLRPAARDTGRLTGYERQTGFRYAIIATNLGPRGLRGVPGSHHPQFIDLLHRGHAVVEDRIRTHKAMGLRNLPSTTWTVNRGWVLAAALAADLDAWTRLLGLAHHPQLAVAEPATMRYCLWHLPARLVTHARRRTLKISPSWPWRDAFLTCWQRLTALPAMRC